ncbi:hypothetical protein D3C77_314650 [compost metagenome]
MLGRRAVGFATQLRQHAAANVAQVGRALSEQGIFQGLLLARRVVDHRHPRCRCTFALTQALVDFITQVRVGEHFLVGDEDFADGLGLAALDQCFDLGIDRRQRLLQTLTLNRQRLTAQRIVEVTRHLNMRRPAGNARRGRHALDHCAS